MNGAFKLMIFNMAKKISRGIGVFRRLFLGFFRLFILGVCPHCRSDAANPCVICRWNKSKLAMWWAYVKLMD
jgi:hypothetical protein